VGILESVTSTGMHHPQGLGSAMHVSTGCRNVPRISDAICSDAAFVTVNDLSSSCEMAVIRRIVAARIIKDAHTHAMHTMSS
jgi:hypothetical protein